MRSITIPALLLFLSGCASTGIPINEVYRIHGLKAPEGPGAVDGIYQDFNLHNDNVGVIWLDPDAEFRGASELAEVKPWMVRQAGDEPYLRIQFSRQGHGTNLMIPPKNKTPEIIPNNSYLKFTLRSDYKACVGIRVKEKDGEIWLYGKKKLDYDRFCTEADGQWQSFQVPLTAGTWVRFPHDGNIAFGNNAREFDALTGVSLELGLDGEDYFSEGPAHLDIKNIKIINHRGS